MNEELGKQLAALSAKIGVSVEHLWSVLIRQAFIEGFTSLSFVYSKAPHAYRLAMVTAPTVVNFRLKHSEKLPIRPRAK
jgi:hypothetical protein